MVTKRTFQAVADALRSVPTCESDRCSDLGHRIFHEVVEKVADAFRRENPRFNRAKFRRACGVQEP